MKASAASIRNLLVVVLVLCADFYLVRDRFDKSGLCPYFAAPEAFQFGFLGSLLMTNLVVVGGSIILSRGGERRTFLAGFVLSGAVAIAALLLLSLAIPPGWLADFDKSTNWIRRWMDRQRWIDLPYRHAQIILRLAGFTVLFTIPELLIATVGGCVVRSRARTVSREP